MFHRNVFFSQSVDRRSIDHLFGSDNRICEHPVRLHFLSPLFITFLLLITLTGSASAGQFQPLEYKSQGHSAKGTLSGNLAYEIKCGSHAFTLDQHGLSTDPFGLNELPSLSIVDGIFSKHWRRRRHLKQHPVVDGIWTVREQYMELTARCFYSQDNLPKSHAVDYVLPSCLVNSSVQWSRATFLGVRCIQASIDTSSGDRERFLFADATEPFLLYRVRELADRPARLGGVTVIRMQDYRRVAPRLVIPFAVQSDHYAGAEDWRQLPAEPDSTIQIDLRSFDVSNELKFGRPIMTAGTIVENTSDGTRQIVPGGGEVLAEVGNVLNRHFADSSSSFRLITLAVCVLVAWHAFNHSNVAKFFASRSVGFRSSIMQFRRHATRHHDAFTLTEVIVVIGIISILMAITLSALGSVRESGRRMLCGNRLRQIGLAMHSYHTAHRQLPMHGGGTAQTDGKRTVDDRLMNHHRLAYTVGLLPFLEQQPLWERITGQVSLDSGRSFPPMGPVPWWNELSSVSADDQYPAWNAAIETYACPSDPGWRAGCLNYAACVGDAIDSVGCALGRPQHRFAGDSGPVHYDDHTKRGLFANWHAFSLSDCTDGLSQTLLIGEIAVGDGSGEIISHASPGLTGITDDPLRCIRVTTHLAAGGGGVMMNVGRPRGIRWADCGVSFSCFNTVLPPNSASCMERTAHPIHDDWFGGIASAASRHPGGAQFCLADGSVRMITSTIDSRRPGAAISSVHENNSDNPPGSPSPYGVWGSLGTRAGRELVSTDGSF